MMDFSDFICPNRSKWEIGRISDDFRNKYWKGKPLPIDMELLIEKELGLEVIPETYIKELTKTDAYLTRDLTAIIIDWDQYMDEDDRWANRLRFSMAHEVGHFVLHRNINQEWINTDELYIEFHKHAPERERRTFEGQANEFAGSLLVPREMLKAEIHKLVDKINLKVSRIYYKYKNTQMTSSPAI